MNYSLKIYVASSWRNKRQPQVVEQLGKEGYEVYDFRHPAPGNDGFHWDQIDREWKQWSPLELIRGLTHPLAEEGYALDWGAMQWAEVGVMVIPCGRSAHLEAGYFVGARKPLLIILSDAEPELMYKMGTICAHLDEAKSYLEIISRRFRDKILPLAHEK